MMLPALSRPPALRLERSAQTRQVQQMDQRPVPQAIGEGMADLLGTQREVRDLLGRPPLADEIWAWIEREGC